jgi:cell division protein FtsL
VKLDNSQIVRERDPRAGRDLAFFLLVVAVLVAGLVLYAFPHLELRRSSIATEQMQRERERLAEENRKLRLEKASLEELSRIQTIAEKQLELKRPDASRVYVVEQPAAVPDGSKIASAKGAAEARN